MTIKTFTFNPFQTNCFVVCSNGEAAIVDPSCREDAEIQVVAEYVEQNELTVKHLLLTHAHIDHIFGCSALSRAFGIDIQMHPADAALLAQADRQAELFGFPIAPIREPVDYLAESDQVVTGDLTWDVIHTPGHSPGSISFVDQANRYVIAGDVLFRGSIGRTDLWQGSLPVLMESIFQKIAPLGDDFVVYPGHGPQTEVGIELQMNPFLTGVGGG